MKLSELEIVDQYYDIYNMHTSGETVTVCTHTSMLQFNWQNLFSPDKLTISLDLMVCFSLEIKVFINGMKYGWHAMLTMAAEWIISTHQTKHSQYIRFNSIHNTFF